MTAQDSRKDLERLLKDRFENQTVMLFEPHSGEKLRFDTKGNLMGAAQPGGWAGDGYLRVRSVKLRGNVLTVTCARLVGFYDRDGSWRLAYKERNLNIEIELPSNEPGQAAVQDTLDKIFRNDAGAPPNRPPPRASSVRHERYEFQEGEMWLFRVRGTPDWKPLYESSDVVVVDELEDGQKVYINTKALQRPRPIETPDPQYSDEARQKRDQGTVKFRVVLNSVGRIHSIQVENADFPEFVIQGAKALSRWRFEPATLDGRPVAVTLGVEINFRLY